MAARDKDGMLGGLREMAQMLQEMISQGSCSQGGVDSDHDVGQGGENKVNSDETSSEQGSSKHQLAGLSTTYNVLVAYKKSDLANLETRNVPVSSGEAVPLSSEPSSSDLTNVEIKRVPITPGKKVTLLRPPHTRMISPSGPPMAHVVKRKLGLSLKPIKDDTSLHDKSFAKRDQLGDSSDLATKYNLPDDEEVTNPIDYTSSDYDVIRDQLQEHFSLLSIENSDSKDLSKIDSPSSDHLKAEQAQYETLEHASDFTFDVKQPVNPAQAPPKPSLQRQNAMRQQRYTRELDPGYSASSLNQPRESITTTASSYGHRPSISMTKALTTATDFVPKRNQEAMMNPHYSQCQVPSGQYGTNTTNSPYLPPSAAAAAEAFQQLGGSNNNTLVHYDNMMTSPPYQRPEQNHDSYNMPQLAASVAPYAYGSVNLFGTSSDNVANSRNHLSSIRQNQRGDSNVWPDVAANYDNRSEIFATKNQQNDRSDGPRDN